MGDENKGAVAIAEEDFPSQVMKCKKRIEPVFDTPHEQRIAAGIFFLLELADDPLIMLFATRHFFMKMKGYQVKC